MNADLGWKADPWIRAMAKLLLSKPKVVINPSTARDSCLWAEGGDRMLVVQEGLRRWAASGQIHCLAGPRARDPLHGATLTLLDSDAVRLHFNLHPPEASYQRQAIDELLLLGVDESRAKALGACLLGASMPPKIAARGAILLAEGSFPSLRAASAHCFAGDSKFLDSREAFVSIARSLRSLPLPAPIAINAWMPESGFERVLFIENFDTFCLFSNPFHAPNRTAIVYCRGFAGSARRIRSPAGRRLFMDGERAEKHKLEAFFDGELPLPCEHFGDLDWAGLDIFLALSKIFTSLSMWAPGCDALLQEHGRGGGHEGAHAGKSGQVARDPALFADPKAKQMARALALNERFVDQEFYIPPSWR